MQRPHRSRRARLDAPGLDRGVRLHAEIPGEKLWVEADGTRVTQIIGNLLHNAAKFTDSGGQVRVELSHAPEEGVASLVVADDGIGIASEALPRIFNAFVQADPGCGGGLGLGVADGFIGGRAGRFAAIGVHIANDSALSGRRLAGSRPAPW